MFGPAHQIVQVQGLGSGASCNNWHAQAWLAPVSSFAKTPWPLQHGALTYTDAQYSEILDTMAMEWILDTCASLRTSIVFGVRNRMA